MQVKSTVMNAEALTRAVTRIAHEILEKNEGAKNLAFVGIYTRGVPLAQRIAAAVKKISGKTVPVGTLDITMYRDDLEQKSAKPKGKKADPGFSAEDKTIILVDDVLYTGRTARAALDAIVQTGRPRQVLLAVLVDRGHRELPIKADFVGKNIPTSIDEVVSVSLKETDNEDKVDILTYN